MTNIFSLEGKKAVVVGGGGGIGQAIAQGLAQAGARVLISSRKQETLEKAAAEIKEKSGCIVEAVPADCSLESSVIELKEKVLELLGTVDILVNAHGLNLKKPLVEYEAETWDTMFGINVRGIYLTCKHFGAVMREKKYGRIINISSIRGARAVMGYLGNSCYSATKGAVDMLTKSLASEWGPDNVTVNAIGPILTMTEMMKPMFENNEQLLAKVTATIPMGRIANPEDCAGPAVFLASDAAAFVTGQIIYPDGGQFCVV